MYIYFNKMFPILSKLNQKFRIKSLKVRSAILICEYIICQIQQIALHGHLAVCSVYALKTIIMFVHNPCSVNGN